VDCRDEQTLIRIVWHDGRPGHASFNHRGAGIEPQIIFVLRGAVAFKAAVDQHRPDVFLKKFVARLVATLSRAAKRRIECSGANNGGQDCKAASKHGDDLS
jgi:hypothetical protein